MYLIPPNANRKVRICVKPHDFPHADFVTIRNLKRASAMFVLYNMYDYSGSSLQRAMHIVQEV